MFDQTQIRQDPLPETMRVLFHDYPREAWEDHPNFKNATRSWLRAHQSFRQLSDLTVSETQRYLDKDRDPEDFAARLGYYGDLLVRNLHGHHNWEDRSYFPELSAADSRFDAGLDVLEQDHQILDQVLHDLTRQANRVIQLVQLDEPAARNEAGDVLASAETIQSLLARHLTDEEELAVPIILHHKLRG